VTLLVRGRVKQVFRYFSYFAFTFPKKRDVVRSSSSLSRPREFTVVYKASFSCIKTCVAVTYSHAVCVPSQLFKA